MQQSLEEEEKEYKQTQEEYLIRQLGADIVKNAAVIAKDPYASATLYNLLPKRERHMKQTLRNPEETPLSNDHYFEFEGTHSNETLVHTKRKSSKQNVAS